MSTAEDWGTIEEATEVVARSKRRVWAYIADAKGRIRTMRLPVEGRMKTFVNIPDLVDYEATVAPQGRPRKEGSS